MYILMQNPGKVKKREVSWTLAKKVDTFAGTGEIKGREVNWSLTEKLTLLQEQVRSREGR